MIFGISGTKPTVCKREVSTEKKKRRKYPWLKGIFFSSSSQWTPLFYNTKQKNIPGEKALP